MDSFREIIELWPSRAGLASAVGAKPARVSKWHQRNSIPGDWWPKVVRAANSEFERDIPLADFFRMNGSK